MLTEKDCKGRSIVIKPLPVLVACAGCTQYGNFADEAALELERHGQGDRVWLGGSPEAASTKARARWPVFALDGCDLGCARVWCERLGVSPQRSYILDDMRIPTL
jgi:uncharacterized metal-binding protein